ncbi:MAG: rRNA maturation RNase YbeY [Prosthecobacter sp.]|jgi:probable rRNA maturation factor|uniref:rRNA maturation RNase YbeY n=1 Tax=Prosthecobacter sp. TaxID=1965333 RepID=UPI0019FDFA3F|nr:rRNA maturation RNase YbeY [Prosthecobacter sp.]MBE2285839.1 rRNA maturation RNase YbeY [Prosthecobacter sp.]
MPLPKLRIYNRQKEHSISLPWLRRIGKKAHPACLAAAKSPESPLGSLPEIEITIVDDADIARVHGDFLDDPTPTDVITFHHGEILISADTAERQGREHGQPFDHEIALYLVHGLLHLAGWDDHELAEAREMAKRQEAILREALAAL